MFEAKEEARANSLVNSFREEQLETLYKLIEIALLKKHPKVNIDQSLLEERFASLVNPKVEG